MPVLTYTITLLEPVLVAQLGGEPNSGTSLAYVPGSAVRGAVVNAYLRAQNGQAIDAAEPEAARLFFRGQVRFLHAYPVHDGERALPCPLSWRSEKSDPGVAYDLAAVDRELSQSKRMSAPFVSHAFRTVYADELESGFEAEDRQVVYQISPDRQVNVHTQRDAVWGRAVRPEEGQDGGGAVYRYQALSAGVTLRGAILCEQGGDARRLQTLLAPGEFLIGGARTAGYGRVRLVLDAPLDHADWRELSGPRLDAHDAYDHVIVRCLSDVLLRGAEGQSSQDMGGALAARLNGNHTAEVSGSWHATVIVGGFNRRWGLPLPQAIGLAAGSTFSVRFDPPVSGRALQSLEWSGIGERLAEGFGRIAFLRQSDLPSEFQLEQASHTVRPEVSPLNAAENQLARQMLLRRLRQVLDANLVQAVNAVEIEGPPRRSQLARWQLAARQSREAHTTQPLLKLLLRERERNSPGWRALERARVRRGSARQRLSHWLLDLAQNEAQIWGWLDMPPALELGEATSAALLPDLVPEYQARLLHAVLDRAARSAAS